MNKVILADNQAIFRAGAARVLSTEDDVRIVAQCDDLERVHIAVAQFHGAILLLGTSLTPNLDALITSCKTNSVSLILLTENEEEIPSALALRVHGTLNRSISAPELVDCVRRVGRGLRFTSKSSLSEMRSPDTVGVRVRERLTPRELQIVGFIVQGCKNKEIASHLNTKEQVIKNYLRSIYDKTGVSDRLELALFTIHHRVLAEAAEQANQIFHMRSA